ncbi:sugar transferase [Shimia sp. SDUM112013]|uniref:sugar transferase n=1 Tax=Shimia sp. SDUM112013 TaxID=3136160 RepID=UPI0032EAC0C8
MLKRIFDILSSLFGLVVFSPLLIGAALFILIDDGRPIFFRQERVGKDRKTFRIFKFRSMRNRPHGNDSAITTGEDNRITQSGRFLRKTKLDELPQLVNVLFGQMSMVGPRPEVPHLFAQYPPDLQEVMAGLRPGITDFASLEYIDESSLIANSDDPERAYLEQVLPEKAVYIRKYADQQGFFTDLSLILRTIGKIFN